MGGGRRIRSMRLAGLTNSEIELDQDIGAPVVSCPSGGPMKAKAIVNWFGSLFANWGGRLSFHSAANLCHRSRSIDPQGRWSLRMSRNLPVPIDQDHQGYIEGDMMPQRSPIASLDHGRPRCSLWWSDRSVTGSFWTSRSDPGLVINLSGSREQRFAAGMG